MDLHYLWGDDTTAIRRRTDELTAGIDRVDRVDVAALPEGGAAALPSLAATPSLFGGTRALVIAGAGTVPAAVYTALNSATAGIDGGPIILIGRSAPAQAIRKAVRRLKVESHNLPANKTFPKFVAEEASRVGIRLSSDAAAALAERTTGNPDRVRSVLAHLAAAGIRFPNTRQVDLLCGSATASVAPWDVTDAVERGDLTSALQRAERVDPFAFAGWIRKRVAQIEAADAALDAAPAGSRAGSVVAEALSVPHWQAQRLVRLARTLDGDTESLWGIVVGLDHRLRSTGVDAHGAVLNATASYAGHTHT